jgi:Domain of unknown function (DUF1707)
MAGEEPPRVRIGHAERTAAQQALDEHLAAGRLDIDEYANRSAAAANAVVAADLAALFTDLPQPHPELPAAAAPPTAPLPVTTAPAGTRQAKGAQQHMGGGMVLLAVAIAVGLFLVTRAGPVFVLIPLAAVVLWISRR